MYELPTTPPDPLTYITEGITCHDCGAAHDIDHHGPCTDCGGHTLHADDEAFKEEPPETW